MRYQLKATALAIAGAFLMGPLGASAADPKAPAADKAAAQKAAPATPSTTSPTAPSDRAMYSDRAYRKDWTDEKERLEKELGVGHDKAHYMNALKSRGFTVTSINSDKPDYTEMEVVKGRNSYEVQIDFDNKTGKSKKVDVTTNLWRTDATKAALGGKTVPAATRYEKGNEAYSDRARMKGWSGEKERLEKSLALGHDKNWYASELKKMGYQVTSVNDNEKDYVEFEVVKGTNSYEVQVDLENGKGKKVDVTTNLWQAEATDRALDNKSKR